MLWVMLKALLTTTGTSDLNCNVYPPSKNKKLSPGVNDLLSNFPEISSELCGDPSTIIFRSTKKQKWQCTFCDKYWITSPKSRTCCIKPHIGCPDCNRRFDKTEGKRGKLLKDVYPSLVDELFDKNQAESLTCGSRDSSTKWVCNKNHVYKLSVNAKVSLRGCPYCSFRKVLIGFNNVSAVRPDLLDEILHQDDENIIANSRKKIKWHHYTDSKIEHVWEASPFSRCYDNTNCQICSGHQIQIGVNDFGSQLDKLSLKWHESNKIKPEDISSHSSKYVTVYCDRHDTMNIMRAPAKSFSSRERVCQDCRPTSTRFRSKGEDEVFNFIKNSFKTFKVESNVRRLKSYGIYEVDIFINEKIAIDYNGSYYHQEGVFKPIGYHKEKRKLLKDLGLFFIEVEESDWIHNNSNTKQNLINQINNYIK